MQNAYLNLNYAKEEKYKGRLRMLDSLRGVAAFNVLLGHLALVSGQHVPLWILMTPLRFFINGYSFVMLFFVLSGYVLAIPYAKNKPPYYFSYLIKRVCRIYVPFLFAIFFAATLYIYRYPVSPEEGSSWFQNEWNRGTLTLSILLDHLAMTGKFNEMWADGVIWSLIVEMRVSIIFPVLIILCKNMRAAVVTGAIIYISAVILSAVFKTDWSLITSDTFAGTLFVTLRYIPFFIFGILLEKYNHRFEKWIKWIPRPLGYLIIFAALLVLCVPTETRNPRIAALLSIHEGDLFKYAIEVLLGAASGIMIVFARNFLEMTKILHFPPVKWLGTISYSLYLTHLPILLFLFHMLIGKISLISISILVIATSLFFASIFYIFVEAPSIKLGKYLEEIYEKRIKKIRGQAP